MDNFGGIISAALAMVIIYFIMNWMMTFMLGGSPRPPEPKSPPTMMNGNGKD